MRKPLIALPFFSFLVLMMVCFGNNARTSKQIAQPAKTGFAVVELFTSEGCSSCPPADDAVAALVKDYPENVFVLGFHVDYWNYLGWKDEFSKAAFTNRQEAYANHFQLNSIYTPQVIVNGESQFTGSEKNRLYSAVQKELAANQVTVISLTAKTGSDKNAITVDYKSTASNESVLCLALLQLHASSPVKKGENKGLLLQHVNVVRDFITSNSNCGTSSLRLPEGIIPSACKVVAFVQNRRDFHISAATAVMIQ